MSTKDPKVVDIHDPGQHGAHAPDFTSIPSDQESDIALSDGSDTSDRSDHEVEGVGSDYGSEDNSDGESIIEEETAYEAQTTNKLGESREEIIEESHFHQHQSSGPVQQQQVFYAQRQVAQNVPANPSPNLLINIQQEQSVHQQAVKLPTQTPAQKQPSNQNQRREYNDNVQKQDIDVPPVLVSSPQAMEQWEVEQASLQQVEAEDYSEAMPADNLEFEDEFENAAGDQDQGREMEANAEENHRLKIAKLQSELASKKRALEQQRWAQKRVDMERIAIEQQETREQQEMQRLAAAVEGAAQLAALEDQKRAANYAQQQQALRLIEEKRNVEVLSAKEQAAHLAAQNARRQRALQLAHEKRIQEEEEIEAEMAARKKQQAALVERKRQEQEAKDLAVQQQFAEQQRLAQEAQNLAAQQQAWEYAEQQRLAQEAADLATQQQQFAEQQRLAQEAQDLAAQQQAWGYPEQQQLPQGAGGFAAQQPAGVQPLEAKKPQGQQEAQKAAEKAPKEGANKQAPPSKQQQREEQEAQKAKAKAERKQLQEDARQQREERNATEREQRNQRREEAMERDRARKEDQDARNYERREGEEEARRERQARAAEIQAARMQDQMEIKQQKEAARAERQEREQEMLKEKRAKDLELRAAKDQARIDRQAEESAQWQEIQSKKQETQTEERATALAIQMERSQARAEHRSKEINHHQERNTLEVETYRKEKETQRSVILERAQADADDRSHDAAHRLEEKAMRQDARKAERTEVMKSKSDRLRELKGRRAAEIAHKREELEAEMEAQQHRKDLEDEENEMWRHEDENGMRRMEVSVKPEDKLPRMPLRQAQDDRAHHGSDAAHTDLGRKNEKHPGHAHPVGFPGTGPGSIPMSPGGVSMSHGPHGYPTGPDSHDNHLGRDIKGGGSSNGHQVGHSDHGLQDLSNQAGYSKFNSRVGDENPDSLGGDENPDSLGGYTDLPKKGKHVGNDHQVVGDGHHGQSGHKAGKDAEKDTKNTENVQKNTEQEPKKSTKVGKPKVTVASNKGVHDAQRKANNHTNEKKPPAAVMKPGVDDRSENRIATKHDDKTAKPEALHKVKSTTTTREVNTPSSSIDKKETRVSMSKNPTNVRHDHTRDENESSHSKSPPLKDHKVSSTPPIPKPHDDNQRKVGFANANPTVISMKVSGSHRTTDVNATSHPKPPSPDQPHGPCAIDTSKTRAQSARNGDNMTVNSSSSKMKSSQSRGTDAVDKASDPKSQALNDPHQPTTTNPKDHNMQKSPHKGPGTVRLSSRSSEAGTMSPSPKDTRTERSHSSSKSHKPNNTRSIPSDVKAQTMQPSPSEPGAKTSNSFHSNMKSKKLLSPFSTPKTEHMHSSASKKDTDTIHLPTIHPPNNHPPFSGIKAVTMQSFEGKLQAGTLHTTVTQHTKIEHLQSIPHHMKSGTIQSPIKTTKAKLLSPFSSDTIAEQLSYPSHHTGTEAIHSWMEKSDSKAMHSPSSNTEYQGSQYSPLHMKSASIGPSHSQKTASTPANTEKRPPLQIGYAPSPNKSVVSSIKSPHDSGKHSTGNSATLRDSGKIGTPKTDVQQGAHQSTHQAHQALQQALKQAPHNVPPQAPHQTPNQPWVEQMMSGANGPGPRKEAISPKSKHTIGSPEKKGFLEIGKRPIQAMSRDDSLKGSRSVTGRDPKQSTPTSSIPTPVILTENPYKPKAPTVNQHAKMDRMSHKHLPTIQTAGFGTKLPTPKITVTHSSFHPDFTDADRHEVQMLESGGRKAAEDELFDHNPLKQQAIRGEKNKQTPVAQHANNKDKGKNIMAGTPTSKSGSLFQRSPDKKSAEPDKHKSNAAKLVEKGKNTPLEQPATGTTSSKRSMIGSFFQAGADKKALKADKLHPEPVKVENKVKPQYLEQHVTGGEKSKHNAMKTPIANPVHSFQKSPDAKSVKAGTPRPKAMAVEEKGKHEVKDKKVTFMGLGKKLATQPVAGEKKIDDKKRVSPHEAKVGATPKIATPKIATPIQEAHKKQHEITPRHHQEATHKAQEKPRKTAVAATPQNHHHVTSTVQPNPKAAEGAAEKKRKEAEHHAQEKHAKDAEALRKKHEQEVKAQKAKDEKAAAEKKKREVTEHLKLADQQRKAKEHADKETEKKKQQALAVQHKQEAERQKKLDHDRKAKEHAAQEAEKKKHQALAAQQKLAAEHQKKLEHDRKEAEKKRKKEIEEREKASKAQENARKLEERRRKKEQEQQQKKEKDRATAAAAAARQKVKPAGRKAPVVRPSVGAKMPVLPKKKK